MSSCEICLEKLCLLQIKNGGFNRLTFQEKISIIKIGRCIPNLKLTQNKSIKVTRHFNIKFYESYQWLTGCVHENKLFCFSCLLFSCSKNVWSSYGYQDLNNFKAAAKKHNESENHIDSSSKLLLFGKSNIQNSFNQQSRLDIQIHNGKVDRNRNIFKRLIDIICFLGKQELALRGHDESSNSLNKGNFLELVDLLATYDGILENHLEIASTSFSGLSNRTQNDLISSVASVMISHIKCQIKQTDFVAVMVDETPDVSGREQLVIILRYFDNSEVVDRFIKYVDCSSDRGADFISNTILKILEDFGCLEKLIAQTYDGAAVLSSNQNGVQKKVRDKCPSALFVWCSAHVLNLILSKSFERIPETKRFFGSLKSMANFFHCSTKRMAYYNTFLDLKKLPRVAETRWAYRSRTVNVIFNESIHLTELFEEMTEKTDLWDGETLTQATGHLYVLKEFSFHFYLKLFNEIFAETDILYNIIQKKTSDIAYCVKKIREFELFVDNLRNKFEEIFNYAVNICGQPNSKRNIPDAKAHYSRICIEILDNVLTESRDRYQNIKNLTHFQLLSHENFHRYSETFPENLLLDFVKNYSAFDFNLDRLRNELKCIYKTEEYKNINCTSKLIEYLCNNNLEQIFPQVLRLAKLIVTIPASSASAERSFSALKRLHTYLRNTQGQQRLTELSTISIEKALLSNVKRSVSFYDDVLKVYLEKDRRVDLIYK